MIDRDEISYDDIDLITNPKSIIGWGCANLIKHTTLSPEKNGLLRKLYTMQLREDKSENIRWRIVHTLGAFPLNDNINFLYDVLVKDPDNTCWVNYGAGRSLIEIAMKNPGKREYIFKFFNDCVEEPFLDVLLKLCEDFKPALEIDGWNDTAIVLLESFKKKLENKFDKEIEWEINKLIKQQVEFQI